MKLSGTGRKAEHGGFGVLILAAGKGTRMHSDLPKVLHPLSGRPMIHYVLRIANALKPDGIGVVIGHHGDEVRKLIQDSLKDWGISRPITFIRQEDPTGSGAAVLEALPFLKKFQTSLVTCGDAPLLTFDTLFALINHHRNQKGQVTILTARMRDPKGYGRILRSPIGEVLRIVEDAHANPKEAAINEINSGTYCFEVPLLVSAVKKLTPQGSKREFYLTDCMEHVRAEGGRVGGFPAPSQEEAIGINNRVQLAQADRILNRRLLERLMLSGVTVVDPNQTYVDSDVEVGQDSVLLPGTILRGKTKIGKQCRIGPYTVMEDCSIGNECSVVFSFLRDARILEKTSVGPFSHVRPGTVAGPRARIGNFTEVKASKIGYGSKVPHLSYIGDAELAEDVNIGAGTITCNYDGKEKHRTTIGAKAFVGSNVNFVAPVKIGKGALIAAGSTITEDVPEGDLAIARSRQVNKPRK
ncbi:MAG: UDP-N-acetylglucosamine diphosphorylase/glucosamine-1-phosphate N-acetyltransferase [Elusimicrobia bacterium GWA2_69_24]|nr:MAG: UDP-N-acetylglucosamine diphosphorylase/glucosamine-1-phosphate N-acetyltransferase [Elusimicrobia bacterium GWA2_69_24]HBL16321.1 UDP-N-acetylglucosamine diphosphorylase/glucosamine-1-phosphate N-acetyltransferase [Elusimicrobiota bacterium]